MCVFALPLSITVTLHAKGRLSALCRAFSVSPPKHEQAMLSGCVSPSLLLQLLLSTGVFSWCATVATAALTTAGYDSSAETVICRRISLCCVLWTHRKARVACVWVRKHRVPYRWPCVPGDQRSQPHTAAVASSQWRCRVAVRRRRCWRRCERCRLAGSRWPLALCFGWRTDGVAALWLSASHLFSLFACFSNIKLSLDLWKSATSGRGAAFR